MNAELPPMPGCNLFDPSMLVYSKAAMTNYGLACYKVGMLRAAQIASDMDFSTDDSISKAIRAEADKEEQ